MQWLLQITDCTTKQNLKALHEVEYTAIKDKYSLVLAAWHSGLTGKLSLSHARPIADR